MMDSRLKPYVPLVEFISRIVGPRCEVVLHDVSDLEHSVVAISSCNLTGRKIGDAVTDLALKVLKGDGRMDTDRLVNYRGKAKSAINGELLYFRSSTFVIRDSGKIIGLLCVNADTSIYREIHAKLNALEMVDSLHELTDETDKALPMEHLTTDVTDLFSESVIKAQEKFGELRKMNKANRQRFVHEMDAKGLFSVKGFVPRVAEVLGISPQTVYRYLHNRRNLPPDEQ